MRDKTPPGRALICPGAPGPRLSPTSTPMTHETTAIQEQARFKGLEFAIGNTPLLEIRLRYKDHPRIVYAKAEYVNFTGSIKDRMAYHILRTAYEAGAIRPGDTIAEATSGNTGIAFSAIGRALGHPVVIFMPDWMSRERVDLIRSLGATIVQVSREEGGFLGSIAKAEALAHERNDVFLPRQFSNPSNVAAHEVTTGPEIWWQLAYQSLKADAFVAGVGTGGTIMGVGRFLRKQDPSIRVYPMEPLESPTLSTGHKVGKHRIQGISDEFIPAIVDLSSLDHVIGVNDGDSILTAQKMASQMGLAVGISSGGNIIAALKVQDEIGPDAVVVTVLSDDNKKYLSTDLLRSEPPAPGYLSNDIEFLGFRAIKRVCATCCDFTNCPQKTPSAGAC
jgi:cysteine synthase A